MSPPSIVSTTWSKSGGKHLKEITASRGFIVPTTAQYKLLVSTCTRRFPRGGLRSFADTCLGVPAISELVRLRLKLHPVWRCRFQWIQYRAATDRSDD